MPVLVHCSACSRELRVPDDLLGQNVRCPVCRHIFRASRPDEAPASTPTPTAPPQDELPPTTPLDPTAGAEAPPAPPGAPASYPPPARLDDDTVKCPGCGTMNPRELASCHNCGYNLQRLDDEDEDERPWEHEGRRDWEPHRGTLVMVLGILGVVLVTNMAFIALPLGLTAWILGAIDLKKMRNGQMDPAGKGNTKAGYICGIIATILSGLMVLACAGFIAFMAIVGSASSAATRTGPATTRTAPGFTTKPAATSTGRFDQQPGGATAR